MLRSAACNSRRLTWKVTMNASGKQILITGPTSGIGKQIALSLADRARI